MHILDRRQPVFSSAIRNRVATGSVVLRGLLLAVTIALTAGCVPGGHTTRGPETSTHRLRSGDAIMLDHLTLRVPAGWSGEISRRSDPASGSASGFALPSGRRAEITLWPPGEDYSVAVLVSDPGRGEVPPRVTLPRGLGPLPLSPAVGRLGAPAIMYETDPFGDVGRRVGAAVRTQEADLELIVGTGSTEASIGVSLHLLDAVAAGIR